MPGWDEFTGPLTDALRRLVQGDAQLCQSSRAQEQNPDKHSHAEEPHLNTATRAHQHAINNARTSFLRRERASAVTPIAQICARRPSSLHALAGMQIGG